MSFRNHKLAVLFVFFISLSVAGVGQQTDYDAAVIRYIMTYSSIAVREMNTYKIPASITLAQGIYESNAGRSRLATEANNHFGIKCHKEWTGDTFIQDDETKDECFRKYDSPEESFRDHSWFLAQRDRYKPLFSLDIKDYKGWAYGLKVAGYATNPRYPELLIKTIETYSLSRFDNPDYVFFLSDSTCVRKDSLLVDDKSTRFKEISRGPGRHIIYTVNGLKLTLSLKHETWEDISRLFGVKVRKLLIYNDLNTGVKLAPGQVVYLEKKKRKGSLSWYVIQPGETMYMVSQFYGIQLKYLYKLNGMKPGKPVTAGRKLLLR